MTTAAVLSTTIGRIIPENIENINNTYIIRLIIETFYTEKMCP